MTVVNVCRPAQFPIRRILHCPVEDRRRRMAGYDAPWYGVTITCLGCGDMWTDGQMHPRPFKPRWRKENIAAAREWWDKAAGLTEEDRRAWIRAEIKGNRTEAAR